MSLQRTMLTLAFGLLVGGIVGAYATTLVYGKRRAPPPKIVQAKCPPCPECRACPPPVDCDAPPPVVTPDAPVGTIVDDELEDERPPPTTDPMRPGLPASAIGLASKALERELKPCRTSTAAQRPRVTMLLDLTITATSGIGHIREADLVQGPDDIGDLEECVLDAAARVQFEWSYDDGESRLRYPLRIGN